MPALDPDPLLTPLADGAPCGADLEHDDAFAALEKAAAGKPEAQYGDKVFAAQGPDWPSVYELALALAPRTRDLRVAVWLARSGSRLHGLAGAVRGLQLVQGLLERHWEHVHPQLDAADGNDPTMRLNTLAALAHPAGIADLRAARLVPTKDALSLRDIELAFARNEATKGEPVPTEAGMLKGVAAAQAASAEVVALMQAGDAAVRGIARALDHRVGAAKSPDLGPLVRLMQRVALAGRRAQGDMTPAGEAEPQRAVNTAAAAPGAIESRDDAMRVLDRVCDWIERNEPSHPAPLLIRRAQRLMKKTFIEIIRDLAPDGLGQVQKLAGSGE